MKSIMIFAIIGLWTVFPWTIAVYAQDSRPNVILILADDLGYGDLSCYGSPHIHTPVLDKLATQGVRLTAFYANGPECTPTRTALLTGRYQQRVGGMECAIGLGNVGRYAEAKALSDKGELGLPPDFSLLPSLFSEKGYATALIGKWHLGEGKAYTPVAHGFDYSIGPYGGAVDYFHHTEPIGEFLGAQMEGNQDFYRNGLPHDRTGYYMNHLIRDEAVEWLNRQSEDRPFFLYLPYTTPHNPIQGPDDFQETPMTMDHWNKGDTASYARMIEDMDQGIGAMLDKVEEKGWTDNTLVIFFSDNGPTRLGNTGGFSGNKGHVFEGGIRVPCIMRWPNRLPAGGISNEVFLSMDITASFAEMLQASAPKGFDGIDMFPSLMEGAEIPERNVFWQRKRGTSIRSAARSGSNKYIRVEEKGELKELLFNLETDPAEKKDLSLSQPDLLNQMRALLRNWQEEVRPERQ